MIKAEALRMLPRINHLVATDYTAEFMVRFVPDSVHVQHQQSGAAVLFRLTKDHELMTGRAHFYGKQAYGILMTETRSIINKVSHERIQYAILCTRDGSALPELSDEAYALDGEPVRIMVNLSTYQQVKSAGVIARDHIASDVRAAIKSQLPGPISATDAANIACRFSPVYHAANDFILHSPLPLRLFLIDSDRQIYSSGTDAINTSTSALSTSALSTSALSTSALSTSALSTTVLVLAMGCHKIGRRKSYWLQVRPMARKIITPPTFFHHGFAVSEGCYKLARNNQLPTNNKPLVQLPPRPVSKIHRERKFRLGPADRVLVNHRFALQNGDILLHILELKDYTANIVKAIRV